MPMKTNGENKRGVKANRPLRWSEVSGQDSRSWRVHALQRPKYEKRADVWTNEKVPFLAISSAKRVLLLRGNDLTGATIT
jgi:hypothetical protein